MARAFLLERGRQQNHRSDPCGTRHRGCPEYESPCHRGSTSPLGKSRLAPLSRGYIDSRRRPTIKNPRRLRQFSRFEENGHDTEDIIWALKGVSFEVKRGEVVGIPSTALRRSSGQGSGQALGAMGRGRRRLLRQAQYKAQDSLPHYRADGGLR